MPVLTIDVVMELGSVIPVIVIADAGQAVSLATRLVAEGMVALEVTLRTPAALDAIRAMATVPGAVVGAGTVLNEAQLDGAIDAGARFIVSPGLTSRLARAAAERGIPYLPGVATAGDVMRGLDIGLDRFKFFPAVASGGIPALRALAAPFGSVRFCPTGGLTAVTAPTWLAEPAVACVGGSWMI